MNWLIYTAASVLSDSSRIYIDNYISDYYYKGKGAASQKYFYAIAFIVLAIILFVIGVANPSLSVAPIGALALFFISGLTTSFAGIPYYKVLELDHSTNLGIFVQLAPILYLILGWLFLGDSISFSQLIAFFVILAAPLLIIFSANRRKGKRVELKAVAFALLYVVMVASANLIFVKQNTAEIAFIIELAFTFLGKGVGNAVIMACMPKWRKRHKAVVKSSHGKVYRPLVCTFTTCIIKDFAQYSAMIAAPSIALASVVADSSKPVVIFLMGLIVTAIWPKFGREDLSRRSIIVHFVATILIVIGIILLQ